MCYSELGRNIFKNIWIYKIYFVYLY
jgi:hypothetical protein